MNKPLNQIDELLSSFMSIPNDLEVAPVSNDARNLILKRKKSAEKLNIFQTLIMFLKLELRMFHLGLTVLVLSAGVFYLEDGNFQDGVSNEFNQYRNDMSIANNTISVNSSTMLTSIPTLIIRN